MDYRKPKNFNPRHVDPSIYLYDEVYDDIKDDTEEMESPKKHKSSAPKYVLGLKENAEMRKNEREIRKFKKYAKEREEEGGSDEGEVFVTETYKAKLKLIEELEREKKRSLDKEKAKEMNYLRRHESRSTHQPKTSKSQHKEKRPHDLERHQMRTDPSKERQRTRSKSPKERCQEKPSSSTKKYDKNSEDKYALIKKKLACRTVGRVLEDAIKRYKKRSRSFRGFPFD